MLIATYSIFNEIDVIEQSICSVIPLVSHFIFIDGAYEGYPSDQDHSTDGTIEKIQETLGDKATIIRAPRSYAPKRRLYELEKRNLYLFYAQKHFTEKDWFFHIDGDEVFEGDATEIQQMTAIPNLALGRINIRYTDGRSGQATRLFKLSIPRMHYWRSHFELWDIYGQYVTNCYPSVILQNCCLSHLRHKRNPQRLSEADYFRGILANQESNNFGDPDILANDPYTENHP